MRRVLILLLVLACRRAAAPPECDGVAGLAVTRIAAHPGGGTEVTARLRFTTGVPIAESDLVQCLSVEGAPASIARRPVSHGYTLLLVDPGAGRRDNDTAHMLVEELVKKRPETEPLAVFRWGPALTQVAPFTSDRRLLLERVEVGLVPADAILPVDDALAAAAEALAAAGGMASDELRTVVLVSPRSGALAGLAAGLERARPHLVVLLGGEAAAAAALPAGLRFPIGAQAVPAQVVSALSDRLDAYRRHAHYAFGLCGPAERPLELRFQGGEPTPMPLAAALPENRGGACQPEAIAHGQRRFPTRIDLAFTPDQKAQAVAASTDESARASFPLSVRLDADGAAIAATARYRGGASLGCVRHSYTLELAGEAPRFLFPGSAARRFELVAMCLDRLYLRSFVTLQLLAAEGLFPIPFDLVEVAVDGVSQGPYLVMENAEDSLQAHSSRVRSLVRRTAGAAATAPEEDILAASMGLSSRKLETALEDRLDLQGYLTWVALMNLVDSGGYGGALSFYAPESTGPDGDATDYQVVLGWDESDAFAGCRAPGPAIFDPHGLLSCAASALDRRIFSDSLLYARYVEVLSSLLERHPPERFEAFARAAASRVLAFLERPEARAGLVELRALAPEAVARPEVAQRLLEGELALLVAQLTHHRQTLLDRLARFRGER
jgi:hypothetical protein